MIQTNKNKTLSKTYLNDTTITYYNPKLHNKPQILDHILGPRWLLYHCNVTFFVLNYQFDSDHYPIGYKFCSKRICSFRIGKIMKLNNGENENENENEKTFVTLFKYQPFVFHMWFVR